MPDEYEDAPERQWLPPITISGRVEVPSLVPVIGDTPPQPTNPFQIRAMALAVARDFAALRALDAEMDAAGYSAAGQTRSFIATTLAGA